MILAKNSCSSPRVLILQGPTASGKSRLALELARRLNGRIINADSMQLYRGIEILTAQPKLPEKCQIPHRLYSYLDLSERASAGQWVEWAKSEIAAAQEEGQVPLVVGGTGLYLKALLEGIAPIPIVPEDMLRDIAARYVEIGGDAFYREACARDSAIAGKIRPSDRQRLVRAASDFEATGRSLFAWQAEERMRPEGLGDIATTFTLWPERSALYAACDARFLEMLEEGAMEEARRIARLGLAPDLPAMKALGLPILLEVIRGNLREREAVFAAQQATRRYAKRQMTWFRHQSPQAILLAFDPRDPDSLRNLLEQILQNWQENLLTGT